MVHFETHEVRNQPPPFEDVDLYALDLPLREGVVREGAAWAEARLQAFGARVGSAEVMELGREANRHTPELRAYDRFGQRVDEVAFHPSWHAVMRLAMQHEVHNLPWREPRPGAHVAGSALHAMLSQVESGSCCPLTMTFACRPALAHAPALAAAWDAKLLSSDYDPRLVPLSQKRSVLVGMAMTEKQGGSDVRANTTRARPLADGDYELVGHKWFCSAPMSDAFLTLAQTDRGLSCFLVPRMLPDGARNPFRIQRLKDKLGNRSNASSEIEFPGTWATRIGDEGRGLPAILEMVHHTRLDCVSGSTGLMRQALFQALHHAQHRQAFGKRLVDQPLMRAVLADLALEVEAATALMLRLARAFDEAPGDPAARAFARLATAVAKYWVCKRAPGLIYEAMECLGGGGYVEESILPRLYREAPVNSIWEGSGNVMCLDVLRSLGREPEALPAFWAELDAARGNPRLDAVVATLKQELARPQDAERQARWLVEQMALALQASLLLRHAPTGVAEAFVVSRLDAPSLSFGALPSAVALEPILERHVALD